MSGRGTHYAGGLVLGLTVGELGSLAFGWSPGAVLCLAAVSTVTGPAADCDQRKWWRRIAKVVPTHWLGEGGPLAHRGITHWTAWGPIIAALWWVLMAVDPSLRGVWWLGYGVACGWASHVILDALFGHAVRTPMGAVVVRRGVPTRLWMHHRWGIWTSGGPGSKGAGCLLCMVAVGQGWLLLRGL